MRSLTPLGPRRATRLGAPSCSLLLFFAHQAAAQSPNRDTPEPEPSASEPARPKLILLVRTEGDDRVIAHLRAELEASEWRTVEIRLDHRLDSKPLAQLARQQGASAAVRVDRGRESIELWIAGGSRDVQELLSTHRDSPGDQVLALRAAETLRAHGLDLPPRKELQTKLQPKAASTRSVRPRPPMLDRAKHSRDADGQSGGRLWAGLAPAVALSPGGLGPTLHGIVSLRFQPIAGWSASLMGVFPMVAAELESREGTARVSLTQLGVALDADLFRSPSWELSAGAGAGPAILTMVGDPNPGYLGEQTRVITMTAFADWCLRARLGSGFHLSAELLAGAAIPRASIHFEDRPVATWGRIFGVAALGIEVPILGGNSKP